jgi:hypothetical protein
MSVDLSMTACVVSSCQSISCAMDECATPPLLLCSLVVGSFVCCLLSSVDRAFELVEGSYLTRTFWLWVHPTVAMMPSVTQPLAFS